MKNYISASILSADILKISDVIKKLEKNNVDMIHFDVMDGVFVNNITYGMPVLKNIKPITNLPFDVHLMIENPLKYVEAFADAGADIITFHLESNSDILETINAIHNKNIKAAIAIKPNTPCEDVLEYLKYIDMVLLMSVEPGFGGQRFMDSVLNKISRIRTYLDENNLNVDIQVDGGIDDKTSYLVKKAGANVLVSGSYLLNSEDMNTACLKMKEAIL